MKIAISAINKIYRTLAINGIIGFLGFFSPRFYSLINALAVFGGVASSLPSDPSAHGIFSWMKSNFAKLPGFVGGQWILEHFLLLWKIKIPKHFTSKHLLSEIASRLKSKYWTV